MHEIHGKYCNQTHVHKPIEGNTIWEGVNMSLSKFSQHYPAKFAKTLAKVIMREVSRPHPVLANDVEEHPTKKRRLHQKLSPGQIAERFQCTNWQTIMTEADKVAPRVGIQVIEQGPLVDLVQRMCDTHEVRHLVLCRGTDRCVGPNKSMHASDAPLRKRICIRRRLETIEVEDEWESWSRLTQKGLRRKATPARVSLTIFARVKVTATSADAPIPESSPMPVAMPQAHEVPEMLDESSAKRCRRNPPERDPESPTMSDTLPGEQRQVIDLVKNMALSF